MGRIYAQERNHLGFVGIISKHQRSICPKSHRKCHQDSREFVLRFREILSSGCSISPVEIGKIVGLDVTSSDFWKLGMRQYEYFVEELEKIVS